MTYNRLPRAGRLQNSLRAAVGWLGWCYLCGMLLWFGLRLSLFDRLWWLALLNTVAPYLFLPLLPLLLLALRQRRRRLALGLLLPCLLFVALSHPLLNPLKLLDAPEQASAELRVMTFNLLWRNRDYPALAEAIRQAQPDVLGVQEVRTEELAALMAALGPAYPYTAIHPVQRTHTVALISRHPIEEVSLLPDPPLEHGLQARVRVGERRVSVVVAHLAPNNMPLWPPGAFIQLTEERYARRAAQVGLLREVVAARSLPTLILCDCNMTDTSEAYARLREVASDTFQQRGWELGHTLLVGGVAPVQRVDYIWHTDELQALDVFVGAGGGSDHLPVVAAFRFSAR